MSSDAFYINELKTICLACAMEASEHASTKCLYAPTYFKPLTCKECGKGVGWTNGEWRIGEDITRHKILPVHSRCYKPAHEGAY